MDLALGIALLLGQQSAEETFNKLEEVLREAPVARIRYKMNSSGKYSDGTVHTTERIGVLLLKEGNKVRIEQQEVTTARVSHPRSETLFVSDGKRMKSVLMAGGQEIDSRERETPKDLRWLLAAAFIRQGDWSPLSRVLLNRNIISPVSRFEYGTDDSGAKMLRFMLSGVRMELWYDPQNFRIQKQTWSPPSDSKTSVQSIEEFSLDAKIPDEKFTLPPAKAESSPEQVLKAQVAEARHDLGVLRNALMTYRVHAGKLPPAQEDLECLYRKPKNAGDSWEGPYIWAKEVLKDPWGKPYVYRNPGQRNRETFDLFSCGPDGKPDTGDDIYEK